MSDARFTSGPWVLGDIVSGYVYIDAPNARVPHYQLARAIWDMTDDGDTPEARANARLIAAAPELYEALVLLEAEMVASGNANSRDYGWKPAIEKTRAALAKARGEA